MNRSLTGFARDEIKAIHALSKRYNRLKGRDHSEILLELAGKHLLEIKDLSKSGDPHFVVETGDLMILCLELIKGSGKSPDVVMAGSYKRYRRKLTRLIKMMEDKVQH